MGRPQLPEGWELAEVTGQLETALDPGGLQDGGVPLATVQAEAVSTQRVQKVVFLAGALGGWAGRGGTLVSSSKAGPATSQPWAALPLAWPSPGWPHRIGARRSPALSLLCDPGVGPASEPGGTTARGQTGCCSSPCPQEVMGVGWGTKKGEREEREAGRGL